MNLQPLFDKQRELDQRIIEQHNLQDQDLFQNKVIALQVELGELLNEWRGFKHWSLDQEPRRDKMLVEFVDCLHFILSMGLDIGYENDKFEDDYPIPVSIFNQFKSALSLASQMHDDDYYKELMNCFLGLGNMLGFSHEQIEEAYMQKNAVNHVRQESGY